MAPLGRSIHSHRERGSRLPRVAPKRKQKRDGFMEEGAGSEPVSSVW